MVDRKFQKGDYVRKTKGSWWEGYVRGFYDTEDNEDGICVQLDKPRGPVQLYPAAAFELAEPARSDLHDLLEEALSVLDGYADPTGYTDNYGEQLPADAVQHQGLLAKATVEKIRAALAKPPKHNVTALEEIKYLACTAGAPGHLPVPKALARILFLCNRAGVTKKLDELRPLFEATEGSDRG